MPFWIKGKRYRKRERMKDRHVVDLHEKDFSPYGMFLKFFVCSMGGGALSLVLLVILFYQPEVVNQEEVWREVKAMLIALPLTAGFVGMFYFEKMLALCRDLMESKYH